VSVTVSRPGALSALYTGENVPLPTPFAGEKWFPSAELRLQLVPFATVMVRFDVSPPLIVVGFALMLPETFGFTVTLAFPAFEQDAPAVTVTES